MTTLCLNTSVPPLAVPMPSRGPRRGQRGQGWASWGKLCVVFFFFPLMTSFYDEETQGDFPTKDHSFICSST